MQRHKASTPQFRSNIFYFFLPLLYPSIFVSNVYGQQQSGQVLPTVVQYIETETKPNLQAAFLNCTVAYITDNTNVNWIRLSDSKVISQNQDIQVQNKLDSQSGQYKYEVDIRAGGSPAIPSWSGKSLYTYMLIIRQLQAEDAGFYRCQINQQGAVVSQLPYRDGLLIVQRQPQIITLTSTTIVEAVVGASFNLTCNADGIPKPNITWQRGTGEPFQNGLERYWGSVVPITNVRRDDRGVYRCYAQNNVGLSDSYDAFVKVSFIPIAKPLRVGGYYGQAPDRNYDVMLECMISGYPDPDVDWYLGSSKNPLQDSTRYEIEKLVSHGSSYLKFDDRIMTLRIRNVISGDYGSYVCAATNKFGSSNTTIDFFYLPTCQGAVCPLSAGISGALTLRPSTIVSLLALPSLLLLALLSRVLA